jgi:multidrug efflux pump subunit AcrA (membrane-fusion protein)
MKKKRVIIALTALIIVGAAVAGYVWVKAKNSSGSRTGTTLAAGGVYVVAAKDVATTTTVSGTIHPLRTVTLTAKAAGTITAVTKKEGDKVAAGEVIARIDSTDYQADLAAAESRYRSTMISLETAQTTDLAAAKTQLENAVKQAQTQLLSAEISLKNGTDPDADTQTIANLQNQVTDAQENLATAQKSLKKLQDDDSSELQLEQADFSVKQAEFNLSMAQTKLATLKAQDVTEEQLTTLQNQVNQAKSSLLSSQVSLKEAAQSSTTSDDRLTLLQNQVDQAQASLDQAEDNLKNASTDNKASESDIDAQAMAVESAQMALVNAEANYKTTAASLAENDSFSAAQLAVTKAERALKTAQANLVAGQKTIANKADNVKLLEANVEQAKASVATAQANLAAFPETQRKAELQIQSNEEAKQQALISLNATKELAENYVITAPLAGTITALNVTVGDNASVGTSVATFSDVTGWYISAYVDEVDILNVKNGEDASVTMDQYSGKTFAGKVSYVSHSLGTTSNSVSAYPIKVLMTESPSTLVDGMSADADITVSVAKGVLAVPSAAISTSNGKSYVDIIAMGADKKVTTSRVEVKTGIEGDEYVEVTSGLKAGDRILRKASTTATTTTSTSSTQSDGTGILPGITGGAGGPRDGGAGFTPPDGN